MMAPQAQSPSERPEELGEFTLLHVLGRGGSGVVYAASSRRHGCVALKVLHEHLALSDRERRRFFGEVERMRSVRHPSLVTLVDAGSLPDGRPFLCMPPLKGQTVAARVEGGRLSKDAGLRYFRGLADGVAALHRAGLVHRDIKPENVLLDEAGERAILLDFGIARELHGPANTTTGRGGSRGTPAYMAPERLFGMPASIATDIYELAVVLYVMLVGKLPWESDTADARLQPRPPAAVGVDLPSRLVTVLMKALSTRPEARPPSASAFAAATEPIADSLHDLRPPTADLQPRDGPTEPAPTERDEPFKPVPGAVVAERYRLDRLLGQGGMGEVWAATHTVTKKTVALKFLRPNLARKPAYRRRFVREARAASQVRHPNVVQIHDVIELNGGVPAMVMELLEGESLADRLRRERVLSLAETAVVMLPVLSAVGAAHRCGIVHRDLKPANIFLSRGDECTTATLLDFGIAKLTASESATESNATLTLDGAMLGTPFYMSPEQIYGEPDVDHRSDIWALGVILFECLAGIRPTQAKSIGQILKIITNREIVPLREVAPHVPPRVCALVMAMLSSKRDERPSSLAHVYQELAASCGATLGGPPRAAAAKHVPAARWSVLAAAVLVSMAAASTAFWATPKQLPSKTALRSASTNATTNTRELDPSPPPLAAYGSTGAAETGPTLSFLQDPPLTGASDRLSERPAPPVKRHGARLSAPHPAPPPSSGPDSWLDQR